MVDDEYVRFLEDCIIDIRREIKELKKTDEALCKIFIERVKPVVDAVELHQRIKFEEDVSIG